MIQFYTMHKKEHDMLVLLHAIFYYSVTIKVTVYINSLNAELNPMCHFLALLGAHHILHNSRIKVNYWNNVREGKFMWLQISN
jgi:hypothetical protein